MRLVLTGLFIVASFALFGACKDGGGGGGNVLTVKALDFSYALSGSPKGGIITFEVENAGGALHEFAFGKVDPGHTTDEILQAIESGEEPDWLEDLGGVPLLTQGKKVKLTRQLPAGDYVFLCFIPNAVGQPHAALGMMEIFTIEGESDAEAPDADAVIEAQGDGFVVPEDLSGGEQTLELRNAASAESEFLLVAFEEGETFDSVGAWFEGGLQGEPPAEFLGGLQIVQPGESVYYAVELDVGKTYTLINEASDEGPPIMTEFTPQ